MVSGPIPDTPVDNLAELLEQLGDIPLERIRMRPAPGTATEQDVLAALEAPNKRLVELVQGVLIEKVMDTKESLLASWLIGNLWMYLAEKDLGIVLGADGAMRLLPGLIRIPDVSFIGYDKLHQKRLPKERIATLVPDLAVEVVSEGNTPGELGRKLRDYFLSGVKLVWFIYPKTHSVECYTSPKKRRKLQENRNLVGGEVLPGFSLPLRELFAHVD